MVVLPPPAIRDGDDRGDHRKVLVTGSGPRSASSRSLDVKPPAPSLIGALPEVDAHSAEHSVAMLVIRVDRVAADRHPVRRGRRSCCTSTSTPASRVERDDVALARADAPDRDLAGGHRRDPVVTVAEMNRPGRRPCRSKLSLTVMPCRRRRRCSSSMPSSVAAGDNVAADRACRCVAVDEDPVALIESPIGAAPEMSVPMRLPSISDVGTLTLSRRSEPVVARRCRFRSAGRGPPTRTAAPGRWRRRRGRWEPDGRSRRRRCR